MNPNLQCWWSPHAAAGAGQRFVKINSRDQELTVYDVVSVPSPVPIPPPPRPSVCGPV